MVERVFTYYKERSSSQRMQTGNRHLDNKVTEFFKTHSLTY